MSGPIDIGAVRYAHTRFLQTLSYTIDEVAREAGDYAIETVAQRSGFKHPTGKLAAATTKQVIRTTRGNRLLIRNTAKYALAQEYGSGLHASRGPRSKYIIRAKRAGALRFIGRDGSVVYRKWVMHPGVPPTRFLFRAFEAGAAMELNLLRTRLARIARRF